MWFMRIICFLSKDTFTSIDFSLNNAVVLWAEFTVLGFNKYGKIIYHAFTQGFSTVFYKIFNQNYENI